MLTRRTRALPAALLGAAVLAEGSTGDALVLARITRHGYILTEPSDAVFYGGIIPVNNTRATLSFVAEVTTLLRDLPGFHEGRYLAAMQLPNARSPLAFYLPMRNDVRGIGQRSSIDGRSELFDINRLAGTAFPLDGFVYLNTMYFYTDPRAVAFGRYLICTQEFGHRHGMRAELPPFPGDLPGPDAGASDGGAADSAMTDGAMTDGAMTDGAMTDGPTTDAPMSDGASPDASRGDGAVDTGPAPLPRDSLLGRGNPLPDGTVANRAHWSYFFHTGGSPMEGNNWEEMSPGVFRTLRPTFRFSELDLYLMGLIPASEVRPTFLIAEPTMVPRGISRDSPPEYYNRSVTVRGRRVDVTVQDIIRANGPRLPAYPDAPRDLDVVWVLLAQAEDVDDQLARTFDEAIESCTLGYNTSTGDRGHLLNSIPDGHDAGTVAPDTGPEFPDVPQLPPDAFMPPEDVRADATASDAAADTGPRAHLVQGGCACRASAPGSQGTPWLGLGALAWVRRRRRRGVVRSGA
jgi:MYXO-CTERM domain-containing protein